MEFFDKLGKKASEAYKITADKTGKIAKETKIKLKINDLKSQINQIYEDIGQRIYQKHIRENDENVEKEVEEMCVKVDVLSDEIESLLAQSLELKDKRQCKVCFTEIEKDAKFCKHCGAKQDDIKESENNHEETTEVQQTEQKEDGDKEGTSVEETSSEKMQEQTNESSEEEKTNLEKTIEIESNVESEESKESEEDE